MAKQTTKAAPLTEEQLLQKEADLKTQSEKLAQDQKLFEQSKSEFLTAQSEHGEAVKAADLDLNARSEALDEREKVLNEREALLENSETVAEEIVPGLSFEIEKEKFKFKDSAPKTILFAGKARTQKELVTDKEALLQLSSNQSLIEKIN